MADIDWQPYFAWWPVYVDAYRESERKNGRFSYLKWGWVERGLATYTDWQNGPTENPVWKYRLTQTRRST